MTVKWYESRSFKALLQSSVLLTLGWVLAALGTNTWDWRTGLAVPLLSNVLVQLRDMWSPTVVGPLSFMNASNVK